MLCACQRIIRSANTMYVGNTLVFHCEKSPLTVPVRVERVTDSELGAFVPSHPPAPAPLAVRSRTKRASLFRGRQLSFFRPYALVNAFLWLTAKPRLAYIQTCSFSLGKRPLFGPMVTRESLTFGDSVERRFTIQSAQKLTPS